MKFVGGKRVGDFLKKVPYDPQKLFGEKNFFRTIKFAKAISRKFSESFWFFALKRKEHVRRESRGGQRELALFSASGLAAQNDVKFAQTHSAKVWSTFLKVAGFGAEPHASLPDKLQFTSFFQSRDG